MQQGRGSAIEAGSEYLKQYRARKQVLLESAAPTTSSIRLQNMKEEVDSFSSMLHRNYEREQKSSQALSKYSLSNGSDVILESDGELVKVQDENSRLKARLELFKSQMAALQIERDDHSSQSAAFWRRKAEEANVLNESLRHMLNDSIENPIQTNTEQNLNFENNQTLPASQIYIVDTDVRPLSSSQQSDMVSQIENEIGETTMPSDSISDQDLVKNRSKDIIGDAQYIPGSVAVRLVINAVPYSIRGAVSIMRAAKRALIPRDDTSKNNVEISNTSTTSSIIVI